MFVMIGSAGFLFPPGHPMADLFCKDLGVSDKFNINLIK